MNRKKAFIVTAAMVIGGFCSTQIFAIDLIGVYKQALKSDPTFKAANQQWLAARENLPINRASLLPQLNAVGGVSRARRSDQGAFLDPDTDTFVTSSNKFYDNNAAYSLTLTQSIFNFTDWAALWNAKATVKEAEAQFAFAAQELMFRVANAYFNVLQAQDTLRYTIEEKKAVGELLRQQKQKFEVGLISVTDLNNTQASYDTQIAQEIADRTALADSEEMLQEITGVKYTHKDLHTLKTRLPLVKPQPQNMDQWVKVAERQNYSLLAAHYNSVAARETIKQKEGGHLPTLDASGSFGYNYDNNTDGSGDFGRQKTTTVGLQLSVPIFSGGGVSAAVRQASHQYQQAVADEEFTHRGTVSQTRQAYMNVVSGISKIIADRQVIKADEGVLTSTQNSYTVGLRTMVEVLDAESNLYSAQKTLAGDQYSYIMQTITLKEQAGTLSPNDLAQINSWLEKSNLAASLEEKDYSTGYNPVLSEVMVPCEEEEVTAVKAKTQGKKEKAAAKESVSTAAGNETPMGTPSSDQEVSEGLELLRSAETSTTHICADGTTSDGVDDGATSEAPENAATTGTNAEAATNAVTIPPTSAEAATTAPQASPAAVTPAPASPMAADAAMMTSAAGKSGVAVYASGVHPGTSSAMSPATSTAAVPTAQSMPMPVSSPTIISAPVRPAGAIPVSLAASVAAAATPVVQTASTSPAVPTLSATAVPAATATTNLPPLSAVAPAQGSMSSTPSSATAASTSAALAPIAVAAPTAAPQTAATTAVPQAAVPTAASQTQAAAPQAVTPTIAPQPQDTSQETAAPPTELTPIDSAVMLIVEDELLRSVLPEASQEPAATSATKNDSGAKDDSATQDPAAKDPPMQETADTNQQSQHNVQMKTDENKTGNGNATRHLSHSEKYILKKVNPSHYTLQLMTGNNQQELLNFAYDNHLQDKVILYMGHKNGAQYYGLIYGDYDTAQQADFAMHKLAAKLNKKVSAKTMQFADLKSELQNELKASQ